MCVSTIVRLGKKMILGSKGYVILCLKKLKKNKMRQLVKRACFEILHKYSSNMPHVVYLGQSKTGLGFKSDLDSKSYDVVLMSITNAQFSCKPCLRIGCSSFFSLSICTSAKIEAVYYIVHM